jgi:hypothetical protein
MGFSQSKRKFLATSLLETLVRQLFLAKCDLSMKFVYYDKPYDRTNPVLSKLERSLAYIVTIRDARLTLFAGYTLRAVL